MLLHHCLGADTCACRGIFKLTDLHFTILISSLAPTFLKWLYSFASNIQCTFCSWETWSLCLGRWVQQALSLVLTCVSFESWFQGPDHVNRPPNSSLQGWDSCTQGQHSCGTVVQPWLRLLRKEMYERLQGGACWPYHLGASLKLGHLPCLLFGTACHC